ncbi:phage terminase small subunit [Comamonas jiangduensis]|uniref:Phage terminase small subunit n=1 Tax=Comamonas jiangduensis TaxID=1194168 RepID=A0ABV4IDU4_9BURK
MPKTPAQRHMARVLAQQEAERAAAADPFGAASGTQHELMLAQLHAHMRQLKEIQATEKKVEAKRKLLPEYMEYLDGVLEADAGVQDPVVTTMMVWLLDVGDWMQALDLAAYCLRHGLQLPDRFNRNVPTLLLDEVSEAALKNQLQGVDALVVLAKVDELTRELDAHDQARAKLHKAIGWAAMGKTSTQDLNADEIKQLELDKVHIALEHLQRAMALNDKVGVKKDVDRLAARLKKEPADQAPN